MEVAHANGVDAHYREMLDDVGTMPPLERLVTNGDGAIGGGRSNPRPEGKSPATTARFKTMNEFADFSAKSVSTTAQAAWWILFRETKPNGLASVSFNQIADLIGLKRRAAIRAVQELEDAGLLTVVKRGSLKAGPSTYRIHGTPKLTVA